MLSTSAPFYGEEEVFRDIPSGAIKSLRIQYSISFISAGSVENIDGECIRTMTQLAH
jgi:hypothetical protein